MGRATAPLACHICAPAQAHHFPRNFRHAESPLSAPDVRKTRGQTYVHTYTYTLDITALDLDMYWQQPASYSPFISKRAQLHIHILSHDNPPPPSSLFTKKKTSRVAYFPHLKAYTRVYNSVHFRDDPLDRIHASITHHANLHPPPHTHTYIYIHSSDTYAQVFPPFCVSTLNRHIYISPLI